MIAQAFAHRLAWVTTTPFGADVEPDVNCRNSGSFGEISGAGSRDSAPCANASTVTRSRAVGTRGNTDHRILWTSVVATTRFDRRGVERAHHSAQVRVEATERQRRVERHRHDADGRGAEEREDEFSRVRDH